MKLSEMLALHPELDQELNDTDGALYLDGVYLFRVLDPDQGVGEATVNISTTEHTDAIVKSGILKAAVDIQAASWFRKED